MSSASRRCGNAGSRCTSTMRSFDWRRRGLHDRLAGTVVVDASVRSGNELVGLDVEELAESN